MNKELLFVVCTPYTREEFVKESQTYEFFRDNELQEGANYRVFYENKLPLSLHYNKFLQRDDNKIIVFIHDDIRMGYKYSTLCNELNKAHQRFDVVGLAGATKIAFTTPTLWHIMARGMSGSVGHTINGLTQMSNYGPSPASCVVVDGLFMSVNPKYIVGAGVKFDERFAFHHYDLDFCIQVREAGLSVGTWPIWVTHMSPGLSSLEQNDWKRSNEIFCKKYDIQ
jgi:protein O-GlcNAc transferase